MELSSLRPAEGSKKQSRRVGRGEASGRGKTSGRGGKGQTARSGGQIHIYFEGGQKPLYRRIPKIGFRSRKRTLGINNYLVMNISDLDRFADGSVIDIEALWQAGVCPTHRELAGIKVLGDGTLTKKLTVRVQAASKVAQDKIVACGGSVEILK